MLCTFPLSSVFPSMICTHCCGKGPRGIAMAELYHSCQRKCLGFLLQAAKAAMVVQRMEEVSQLAGAST